LTFNTLVSTLKTEKVEVYRVEVWGSILWPKLRLVRAAGYVR